MNKANMNMRMYRGLDIYKAKKNVKDTDLFTIDTLDYVRLNRRIYIGDCLIYKENMILKKQLSERTEELRQKTIENNSLKAELETNNKNYGITEMANSKFDASRF